MRKSIIVAASQNGVIGKDGQLPWRLPGDLKRFKQLTMGHALIMGRKTFESIGRPLPGRTTIVMTRREARVWSEPRQDLDQAPSWALAYAIAAHAEQERRFYEDDGLEHEVFVCGGGEIYREALPLVDRVYLTVVERDFEGDVNFFFYKYDVNADHMTVRQRGGGHEHWQLTSRDRGDGELPHRFEIWDRVR